MKVLSAAQMRQVDHRTASEHGISGPELMENAGAAVARFLRRAWPERSRGPVSVVCGKGNNGGDGLVTARLLRNQGCAARVILLAKPEAYQGEALQAWNRLQIEAPEPAAVVAERAGEAQALLEGSKLLVDAIYGTGLDRPPQGIGAEMIAWLNQRRADVPLVAIDMPSGLPADGAYTREAPPEDKEIPIVKADWTITFTAPKLGQLLGPYARRAGRVRIESIGTPAAELESSEYNVWVGDADLARPLLKPRPAASHKGSFGHVLVLAGSRGKSGAAAMAATAALRMGAGLATAAVPAGILPIVAGYRPELMTHPLPETAGGALALAAAAEFEEGGLWAGKNILAAGPGLGQEAVTVAALKRVLAGAPVPWVLDADGLNAFAGDLEALAGLASAAERRLGRTAVILTPHPGEMSRLLGVETKAILSDRAGCARRLAQATGAVVVLKGHRSLTVAPDGRMAINTSGNPGMATAGTGDILTGLMAGLWAQQASGDSFQTAAAAVYLHGLAGDLAMRQWGQRALLATDLLTALPAALRRAAMGTAMPYELEAGR